MKKPRKAPVSSFGPEVLATLLRGARERFEVSLPYNEAISFHLRLHSLRRAMREEQHPQLSIVERVTVSVVWGEKAGFPAVPQRYNSRNVPYPEDRKTPAKLIVQPHDLRFRNALTRAGVHADELKEDPLQEFPTKVVEPEVKPGFDYLDEVTSKKHP